MCHANHELENTSFEVDTSGLEDLGEEEIELDSQEDAECVLQVKHYGGEVEMTPTGRGQQ